MIDLNKIKKTKDCIDKDISDANACYKLYFDCLNIIRKYKIFYNDFATIFFYFEEALDTKYILALAKLFSISTKEEGLLKLAYDIKNFDTDVLALRYEGVGNIILNTVKKQRKLFLKNFNRYIKRIKVIEEKINPLRNIQRAHNYPYRGGKYHVSWAESKRWLKFAEALFVLMLDGICEPCPRAGNFLPENLDKKIRYFNLVLYDAYKRRFSRDTKNNSLYAR
ncbi:MAG: hypothetical protein AB1755_03850 [Candidatus Omnitrophota bacterium]